VKVAFVASEGVPFSKTGGLADVVGALPKALAALGHEVAVILPRYRITPQGTGVPTAQSLTLPLGSGYMFAAVQDGGRAHNVQTYLIDCPEYFDRDGLYQKKGEDYPDNAHRFAGFSFAALEFLKHLATPPDIIHCHDWQTALLPIYLRNLYRTDSYFARSSVVFTLHNLGFQGLILPHLLPQISLHAGLFTVDALEFFGMVNLLKGGIIFSDFITTVSRKYAEEIQTPEFGYGLEGVLYSRAARLQGIVNGVDYEEWDPATDKNLVANYTPANLQGKKACKKALLEGMGAAAPVLERPVIGIVSRFATQKGFDLIARIAEKLAALDLYIVALGTGEPAHEELFRTMAAKYPDKFLVKIAYDNALAHQIEAGSDMFLMPSRYEPCGLNQIYSLKYGTVPIVRATGGLDDTIQAFDGASGTGFKFHEYSPQALLATIQAALEIYAKPDLWRRLMQNGMKKDYSWATSAKAYSRIYETLRTAKA
jgi:starch synthase